MPKRSEKPKPKKLLADIDLSPPKVIDESKATITYHVSYTKNMGNYESMKVEAGVTLPINFTDEMLDGAMEKVQVMRDKLTKRLMEDLDELEK